MGVRGICYDAETNSILLVNQTYSNGWVLPGGGVEVHESTLDALKRELKEETGLECMSAKVLDVWHNKRVSKRDHVVIYLVEEWTGDKAHQRQTLEISETAWFRLDNLPCGLTSCSKYALNIYLSESSTSIYKRDV